MNDLKLKTTRTQLNTVSMAHLEVIHHLHSLPETDEFNALGIPKDLSETKRIVSSWVGQTQENPQSNYYWAIETRDSTEFIGLFGLKVGAPKYRRGEVWFKIHPRFWNKGYATEVLKGVMDYAFSELKLHRVHAGCAVGNPASARVLEKVGMIKEGRMRGILPLKSGWSDNFEYGILETDPRS